MTIFTIPVYETVVQRKDYEVEADHRAEAEAKALWGDTVSEGEAEPLEVIDRNLASKRS